MRRRDFITLLGGSAAAAWPLAARAQQADRIRRVGVLMNGAATETAPLSYVAAFAQKMRQLGWTDGQNLHIDVRWNAGDAELARTYAAQLIGLMPDVILVGSTTNLMVIRQATNTVPVIFLSVSDPVAQGFVPSLTHPGGNLTGFSSFEFSIGSKWLDMLKEVSPGLSRVAVMFNPDTSPQSKFFMQAIEAAAPSFAVQAIALPVRATSDIEPALESFAHQPNGGLIVPTDTFLRLRQMLVTDLAFSRHLPSIGADPDFARGGGLMYYGVTESLVERYQQAATYADRILKGTKPGDLPVQLSDKYSLVINLKTAKALGLTVPLPLLGRADEVIE
jgi:putative tryptophan/tyrosine transport system substrate-binding protein